LGRIVFVEGEPVVFNWGVRDKETPFKGEIPEGGPREERKTRGKDREQNGRGK